MNKFIVVFVCAIGMATCRELKAQSIANTPPRIIPCVSGSCSVVQPGVTVLNAQGDATTTPSLFDYVTSTNAAGTITTPSSHVLSTVGLASGLSCIITRTFVSAGIYNGNAYCSGNGGGFSVASLFTSTNLALGSESWATASIVTSYSAQFAGAITAPRFINSASGNVTANPGTGVTSVTCTTASCTTQRGTYTIVGGTATTGTIATLAWPNTGTAWVCTATMNGGTGFLGIGNSVATTTGMNITAGVALTGLTVIVNYSCQP